VPHIEVAALAHLVDRRLLGAIAVTDAGAAESPPAPRKDEAKADTNSTRRILGVSQRLITAPCFRITSCTYLHGVLDDRGQFRSVWTTMLVKRPGPGR